jgi:hypothetical protein
MCILPVFTYEAASWTLSNFASKLAAYFGTEKPKIEKTGKTYVEITFIQQWIVKGNK